MPPQKEETQTPPPPTFVKPLIFLATLLVCTEFAAWLINKWAALGAMSSLVFIVVLVYIIVDRVHRDYANQLEVAWQAVLLAHREQIVEEMSKRYDDVKRLIDNLATVVDDFADGINPEIGKVASKVEVAITNIKQLEGEERQAVAKQLDALQPLATQVEQLSERLQMMLLWAEEQAGAKQEIPLSKEISSEPHRSTPEALSKEDVQKIIKDTIQPLYAKIDALLQQQKEATEPKTIQDSPSLVPSSSTTLAPTWESLMESWVTQMEYSKLKIKLEQAAPDIEAQIRNTYTFFSVGRWNELAKISPTQWNATDIEPLDRALYSEFKVDTGDWTPALSKNWAQLHETVQQIQQQAQRQLAKRGIYRIGEQAAKETTASRMSPGRIEADAQNDRLRIPAPEEKLEYRFYRIVPGRAGYEYNGQVIANQPTHALYYRKSEPQS